MNDQHCRKVFHTNTRESVDICGRKSCFWLGLSYIPPVCSSHCRRYKCSPVNMTAIRAESRLITTCYHKLKSKKEGMTECCPDNDGALGVQSSQLPVDIWHGPVQRLSKVPAYCLRTSFTLAWAACCILIRPLFTPLQTMLTVLHSNLVLGEDHIVPKIL